MNPTYYTYRSKPWPPSELRREVVKPPLRAFWVAWIIAMFALPIGAATVSTMLASSWLADRAARDRAITLTPNWPPTDLVIGDLQATVYQAAGCYDLMFDFFGFHGACGGDAPPCPEILRIPRFCARFHAQVDEPPL